MCWAILPGSGVSSVPTRTFTTSGWEGRRLYNGEPQWLQNTRNTPGEDSNSRISDSPCSKRSPATGVNSTVANAVPVALRQREQ